MKDREIEKIADAIMRGDLVVMLTDTIYGIVASASDPVAIEKLYSARKRNPEKASIVLLTDVDELPGVNHQDKDIYRRLNTERPTTIILPVDPDYLPSAPRQDGTLAFRIVDSVEDLSKIIKLTGPLLAPSANPEGLPPATNIEQAKKYFKNSVAIYVDGGESTSSTPSRIVKIQDGQLAITRN